MTRGDEEGDEDAPSVLDLAAVLLRFGQPPLRELGRPTADLRIVDEVASRAQEQFVETWRALLDEAVDKLAARLGG